MTIYKGAQRIAEIGTLDLIASLRWINHAYDSEVLTLREDNGDTEETVFMDKAIGFIDDNSLVSDGVTTVAQWKIDTGATNLLVPKWWDSSGNGNHLIQTTDAAQPKLNLNGAGVIATIEGDGTDDFLKRTLTTSYNSPSTLFTVYKSANLDQETGAALIASLDATTADSFELSYNPSDSIRLSLKDSNNIGWGQTIEPSANTNINLITGTLTGVNRFSSYFNALGLIQSNFANGFLGKYDVYKIFANRGTTKFFEGNLYETLVYKKELSEAARVAVRDNIIAFYGIIIS